jgi:hypothetical protein
LLFFREENERKDVQTFQEVLQAGERQKVRIESVNKRHHRKRE